MAGIRGARNPMPSKGKKPTGIFSTNGTQKQDGISGPHMNVKRAAYAHNRKVGKPDKASGVDKLRHQAPMKRSNLGAKSLGKKV